MNAWHSSGSYQDDETVSPAQLELDAECYDNHADDCPCRYGGDVRLPTIVIESNDGYVVVADVA